MIYFSLAIGLILVIFLSFATYGLWIKHANPKMVKGFLFPGTIVHELSHALLCLITGTTIKELNLFTPNNTGIKYDKPKVPFLFNFVIAAAPIFGCAFFIFFISKLLFHPIHLNNTFPQEIHFTFKGFFDLIRHLLDTVWVTFNTFKNELRIVNIRHIFFLLTIIIFTISMAPHKQDIKHLVLGFGIISLILFFLEKAGIHLLGYKWWSFCIKEFWLITTLTISVLATLLFITLTIMGIVKGYRLTFGHKDSSK
ncbi:MAG: M50 family metallopeptidase [Candidatus Brocadia sp.]|nr:M50 family metallopeptidase [Candidatus Brocadia sp.]